MRVCTLIPLGVLLLAGCGGGGGGGSVTYDPDQVSQGLSNKITVNGTPAVFVPGTPPVNPTPPAELTTNAPDQPIAAQAGSRVAVSVSVNFAAALESLFAKVPNASSFFQASLSGGGKASQTSASSRIALRGLRSVGLSKSKAQDKDLTTLTFEVDVPADLEPGGQLCFEFTVRDVNNLVSNTDTACLAIQQSASTPSPTPSPTPGSNNTAAACFNPTLFEVGTEVQSLYRTTFNGVTEEFDESFSVARASTFNGNSVVEFEFSDGEIEYVRGEPANQRLLVFGFNDPQEDLTCSYDPPLEFRYDLSPGQSYSINSTVSCSDGISGSFTETSRYVGRERITVPAGSFDSCRFTNTFSEGGFTAQDDGWYSVGTGIELQIVGDEFTDVLVSGSINGQPLTGN